uniref:BLVR domain-containing protein n=1 Tax=Strongyloides papillosus TaxID=174720 RepID=A0A0N5BSW6_STREA
MDNVGGIEDLIMKCAPNVIDESNAKPKNGKKRKKHNKKGDKQDKSKDDDYDYIFIDDKELDNVADPGEDDSKKDNKEKENDIEKDNEELKERRGKRNKKKVKNNDKTVEKDNENDDAKSSNVSPNIKISHENRRKILTSTTKQSHSDGEDVIKTKKKEAKGNDGPTQIKRSSSVDVADKKEEIGMRGNSNFNKKVKRKSNDGNNINESKQDEDNDKTKRNNDNEKKKAKNNGKILDKKGKTKCKTLRKRSRLNENEDGKKVDGESNVAESLGTESKSNFKSPKNVSMEVKVKKNVGIKKTPSTNKLKENVSTEVTNKKNDGKANKSIGGTETLKLKESKLLEGTASKLDDKIEVSKSGTIKKMASVGDGASTSVVMKKTVTKANKKEKNTNPVTGNEVSLSLPNTPNSKVIKSSKSIINK